MQNYNNFQQQNNLSLDSTAPNPNKKRHDEPNPGKNPDKPTRSDPKLTPGQQTPKRNPDESSPYRDPSPKKDK
jgi:hypothetical protein